MSEASKRSPRSGPCEAELVWFDITDLWYATLRKRGQRAALVAAQKALDAIAPPADTQQRAGGTPPNNAR